MKKTTTIKVLITIDVTYDEGLRDDQIELIALESIYVKHPMGIIGNLGYRSEEIKREIFYYEP